MGQRDRTGRGRSALIVPLGGVLRRRRLFVGVIVFFVALGVAAEFHTYIRPDIGFLLYAARRVVDGATLYTDVVEINPPLIVWLNMPSVMLARLLHLSDILVYRVGFGAALVGAIVLAARALQRAIPDTVELRRLFLALFAFVLFPLSAQDYGQREHLLLALVVPWLLNVAARAAGRPAPRLEGGGVALLAGLAFALKPHFLLLWLAVEVVVRSRRAVPPFSIPPETAGVVGFLVCYAVAVLTITPQYFPFITLVAGAYGKFLYDGFLHLMVTGPGAALIWLALLAAAALWTRSRHRSLWAFLVLAVIGCFAAGAVQQKGLRYHFYPAFGLGIILLGVVAADTVRPLRSKVQRIYHTVAASVVAAAVIVVVVENMMVAFKATPSADERGFQELVDLVRRHAAGGSVFVMSYHIGSSYPLINYSGVESASRFPQLWIAAAEYRDRLLLPVPLRYREVGEMDLTERYFRRAVLEDLETHRPEVLIVLRNARDLPRNGWRRIDYIAYFGRDARFAEIFTHYEWIRNVGDFAVYRRLRIGESRIGPAPQPTIGDRDVVGASDGRVHLQFGNPAFLLRVVVFGVVLAYVAGVTWRRGAEAV